MAKSEEPEAGGGGHSGEENLQEGTRYCLIYFHQNQAFEIFYLISTDFRLFLLRQWQYFLSLLLIFKFEIVDFNFENLNLYIFGYNSKFLKKLLRGIFIFSCLVFSDDCRNSVEG